MKTEKRIARIAEDLNEYRVVDADCLQPSPIGRYFASRRAAIRAARTWMGYGGYQQPSGRVVLFF